MTKKILIVDDNLDLVDILKTLIEHLGYDSIAATNGREAVEIAASRLPDLILLDISLPDMDGFAAACLIRRNPKTHTIPILATTGRASSKDQEQGLRNGCDDYISKPFTSKELVSRIEDLLVLRHKNNISP